GGGGDAVAVGGDGRGVGGRLVLQRGRHYGEQVAWGGAAGVAGGAQAGGIVAAGEGAQRDLAEVRVAQVEGAVAERAAHGLDDQVRALRGLDLVQEIGRASRRARV